ncbi:MAG TPA: hypothetical protein VGE07_25270 [Herpetosiphonaceae bacterium]
MGTFDSSKTRVTPVFTQLLAQDATGQRWLAPLLQLFQHGAPDRAPLPAPGPLTDWAWGRHERRLPAPRGLLRWLVTTGAACATPSPTAESAARKALRAQDPAVVAQALTLLAAPRLPATAWYILEGPSQPDVYLETPTLIVVLEGKRTERGPTTATTWMPIRHQLLRHLDAAWNGRAGRTVVGGFVVEGDDDGSVPAVWQQAAKAMRSPLAITASLPHRTAAEQAAISAGCLGVTTWQQLCTRFGIAIDTLPERA